MAEGQEGKSRRPGTVEVEDLWERFRIYHTKPRGIKERLFRLERARYEEFWALKGVSFQIAAGESFAVLGRNGSGKSTLLKCITGILPPDKGRIASVGRTASLLELGAGFHGDLTGRENVYLNGSILGMRRREVDEAFDEIVRFAGVEEFIDTPVRTYSSGMYVRLGFAIATHVDPDILLIDEILAVGDAEFQLKCFDRMNDFRRRGKTIVLVTHDLDAAARMCSRAILLEAGEVLADGPTLDVAEAYRQTIAEDMRVDESRRERMKDRYGTGEAEIVEVSLIDEFGKEIEEVMPGDKCSLRMVVRFINDVDNPAFGYNIRSNDGFELYNTNTLWRGMETGSYREGQLVEVLFHQRMNLIPGRYVFTVAIAHRDASDVYDLWDGTLAIEVMGPYGRERGYADLDGEIEIRQS